MAERVLYPPLDDTFLKDGKVSEQWAEFFVRVYRRHLETTTGIAIGPGSGDVKQDGAVVPGNLATWASDKHIQDGGPVPGGGGGPSSIAEERLLGRGSGVGSGPPGEIAVDATLDFLGSTLSGGVPHKVIAIWSGLVEDIPTGWALCNGGSGTPDLSALFIP